MFLSKRSNGFYYIYYENERGRKTCISTKTKFKNEALKFLSNFKEEIKNRLASKVIPIELKKFELEYLSYSETIHSINTTATIQSSFNNFLNYFGNIQLSEITSKKLHAYFEERIRKSSIYQARKDRIHLGAAFNKAVSEGYLLNNPFNEIKRFKIPEKQPLFFSQIDFEILLKAIDNSNIKDLVEFAVNTGQGKWNY